jgi:hypothetical protein
MLRSALLALAACACVALVAAPSAGARPTPNSANRMVMWVACSDLVGMSDAQLDRWRQHGVGGFVCQTNWLYRMGGAHQFSGNLHALDGPSFSLERRLRDTHVVDRLRRRGMKAYLGTYMVNYWNHATPLADWFDDRAWREEVIPSMTELAAGARALGFAGLAFDQELYPQDDGQARASWNWDYAGNRHSQRKVRGAARRRGRQLMRALVKAFPKLQIAAYDVQLPGTWGEVVQRRVNGIRHAYSHRLDVSFWNGLTTPRGYGAIRLYDATFYKMPHFGTWDSAFRYAYNSLFATLSRRFRNWSYAGPRVSLSPFGWIDTGPDTSTEWDDARSPAYVAEQLAAFRRWGMDGEFANYAYNPLRNFNYAPYARAMEAASRPGVVDRKRPHLGLDRVPRRNAVHAAGGRRHVTLKGTVRDNLAVRLVRWRTASGKRGAARMYWHRGSHGWHTRWVAKGVPLRPGANKIVVEVMDIKGLVTRRSIVIGKPAAGPGHRRHYSCKDHRQTCTLSVVGLP